MNEDRKHCRHPEGPQHSCDYVRERDRLIPRAEHEAATDPRVLGAEGPKRDHMFSRVFIERMEKLAVAAGLCEPGPVTVVAPATSRWAA